MRHKPTILTRASGWRGLRLDAIAAGPAMMTLSCVTRRTPLTLWTVGLLLAVTACSSPDAQPDASLSTTTRSATLPPTTAPTSPPGSDAPSTAEAIAQDVAAIIPTLEPPAGAEIVEGSLEYFRWVGRCAEALGAVVAVTTSPPAIFGGEGPSNRRDGLVIRACLDAAGEQSWFVRYPFDGSDDARAVEYDLNLQIHQCLEENGYPTVEPPSKEAYVAGEQWNPYEAMGTGTVLYINPFIGDAPGSSQQLEAQERCGASLAEIYQQQVIEGAQP